MDDNMNIESSINMETLPETLTKFKPEDTTPEEMASTSTKKGSLFHIDSSGISSIPVQDQAEELKLLGLDVYNQTEFEEGVLKQVDDAFKKEEMFIKQQIMQRDLNNVVEEIRTTKQRLRHLDNALKMAPTANNFTKDIRRKVEALKREKENREKQLKKLLAKQHSLSSVCGGSNENENQELLEANNGEEADFRDCYELAEIFKTKSSESKQEEMIRTGQMTPFGTVVIKTEKPRAPALIQSTGMTDFEKYLLDQAELKNIKNNRKRKQVQISVKTEATKKEKGNMSNADINEAAGPSKWKAVQPLSPPKKIKRKKKEVLGTVMEGSAEARRLKRKQFWNEKEEVIDLEEFEKKLSDTDYIPSSDNDDDADEFHSKSNKKKQKRKLSLTSSDGEHKSPRSKKLLDDGNQEDYLNRIRNWHKERLKRKHDKIMENDNEDSSDSENEYEELEGGYKIPLKIWNKLYKYQQTCVQWLWELHCQRCGGIIGDEMGLGKTIQVIAFFSGLWNSKILTRGDIFQGLGPVIIVTPTTIMHQWVKEFHTWWPPIRVAVLHESGSYSGTKESLVRHINNNCGVLITSYSGLTIYQDELLRYEWHYIILDEGHKIRNPDAQATLVCKQFRTAHRLILSGSPLQNNLKELWSLFDFIFPGKLGTLPVFMQQFSVPITLGGYANATDIQVQTAYKCATVLRDTISPYLLRRMKADVKMNLNLPRKNEQVLFCRLTDEQRQCYKEFLESDQLKSILDGRLKVFVGLIHLRKICNHPDLYSGGPKHFGNVDESTLSEEERFGFWKRSGKMIVIEAILKIWHQQKHRVLFFTQSRQMLHILEYFIKTRDYSYMKMDGSTSISSRQPLINQFNNDPSIFIFLLTTRVGGLGVNLTGADRVIIFDPDWNPSTDLQARERAWRIGQRKDVTIYRLLTTGTIEEKIYHRQIFKQFLTNRVLKDPRQRRFFKNNDLHELFTLQDTGNQGPESMAIFAGTGSEIKAKSLKNKRNNTISAKKDKKSNNCITNDHDKISENNAKHNLPKNNSEMNLKTKMERIGSEDGACSAINYSNMKTVNESSNNNKGVNNICNSEDIIKTDNDSHESLESTSDSVSALKLAKMKELAKQLSQQIAKKYENNTKMKNDDNSVSKTSVSTLSCNSASQWDDQIKNKKKKGSKKKRKSAVFEGQEIDNLVSHGTYENKEDAEHDHQQSAKHDDYVLQKLFAKSGVHSALRHDVIIQEADPDFVLVEKEAERVAHEAVKQMKRSRRSCYKAQLGIPNWTGSQETHPSASPKLRFGQKKNNKLLDLSEKSSFPSPVKKSSETSMSSVEASSSSEPALKFSGEASFSSSGVMSSSQLLAKIKARNHSLSDSDDEASNTRSSSSSQETKYDELLVDLRNFIAFQSSVDGQATTQEILDAFRNSLPAENSPVFKSLLHKICDFQRNSAGQGVWFLKSEFR